MALRIFLTGGTGYIGGVLASRLVAAGHEVRALVRPTNRGDALAEAGARLFVGDVTERISLREGMSGADWVIHAAADLEMGGPPDRMRAVNVEGSENVASLAYKLGVGRLLAVSSIAAFGGSADDGSLADESSAPRPFPSLYAATKHAADARVAEWARRGLPVSTVYPGLVYGPPGKKKGANAILRLLVLGRVPFLVGADRKTSWVFVDDVVEALLRVIERGEPGRGYILAGEVAPMRRVVEKVCALAGVRPPRPELPLPLARAVATLAGPLYRFRGRRPPFSREQLGNLGRHWAFDDGRARRELAWKPRGLEAGLPPTVAMLTST